MAMRAAGAVAPMAVVEAALVAGAPGTEAALLAAITAEQDRCMVGRAEGCLEADRKVWAADRHPVARSVVPFTGEPILRRGGIRWADHLLAELRRDEVKRGEVKLEDRGAGRAVQGHAAERKVAAGPKCGLRWQMASGTRSVAATEARLEAPTQRSRGDLMGMVALAGARNFSVAEALADSVAGVADSAGVVVGDIRATGSALAAGAADGDSVSAGESGGILIGRSIRILIGTVCGGAIRMDISGRRTFIRTRTRLQQV